MGFPILGANTESAAYEISNSLRFNDGDSPYLSRTTGSPTNEDMVTISAWIKRSTLSANHTLMSWNSGNGAQAYLRTFNSNDNFQLFNKTASESNTSIIASAASRDVSAWYHLVLKYDAAQSTSSDRVKLYINGTEQTLGTSDYPPQNTALALNVGSRVVNIGRWAAGSEYVDGYVSEFAFIDGQALAPTVFGETNDNGVWIPKEFKDDVTFGNNGFYLEFKQTGTSANSSGIGADTSGNDNHFAVNNLAAIDVTEDTPTNNFCTWNPLANYYAGSTFSEGNCYLTMADSVSTFNAGTFGLTSGKWYWETKVINIGSGSDNFLVGAVSREDSRGTTDYLGEPTSVVYRNNGQIKKDSGNATHGASFGVNDIVMVALDLDNNNIYFGSNGNWADGSGNNDESSPTSAVSLTNTMITEGTIFPAQGDLHGNTPNPIASTNFGNPPHSISSGNSDANGYGNFEYAVPSGHYALCTKNLAEYG